MESKESGNRYSYNIRSVNMSNMYRYAQEKYAAFQVDVEQAVEKLKNVPVSVHCWQGDDVTGLESSGEALSGGIQVTGNYPGKARNFEELKADFLKAMQHVPGKKRISLHACYAVFEEGRKGDRDQLLPEHFKPWVEFAKENDLGIDFNPTFFSHPMVKNNLTLSSPDEEVRSFWIRHGIACRRIAAYFAKELGTHSVCNVWIADGYKDVPADKLGPRKLLKDSLDQIFAEDLPGVIDCVESKVFGIGLEAYTVGSSEFYFNYAATNPKVYNLLDSGHYYPTETIADKLSALLCFRDYVPLHVTRRMHWDSDHVVTLTDELKEIAQEIVRCDALDKVLVGLDYFDGSINRVAAWAIGARNMQKALLWALLMPNEKLKKMQEENDYTGLLFLHEELKTLPFTAVWEEYCRREGVINDETWFEDVKAYEQNVLMKRG